MKRLLMLLINVIIGFFMWFFSFEDDSVGDMVVRFVIIGLFFLGLRLVGCADCSGGGSHEPIDWLRGF